MSTHVLTEEVTGPVHAAAGDLLEVHLVENAGTGYVWEVAFLPSCLTPASDEVITGGERVAAGASALHVIGLHADAAGSGEVIVALRRAWEPEPLRTASWLVQVG